MADRENHEVIHDLVRFMERLDEPEGLPVDVLLGAYRQVEEARLDVRVRVAKELRRRDWSWRQIGKALGVSHKSVYEWVNPRPPRGENSPDEDYDAEQQDVDDDAPV